MKAPTIVVAKVHAARTVTEKAIEKGEYKLRKAGADLEKFKKEDEAFHEQLVSSSRLRKPRISPRRPSSSVPCSWGLRAAT